MPPRGVKSKKRKRQYEKVLESIKSHGSTRAGRRKSPARIVNKTRRKKGETKKRKKAA